MRRQLPLALVFVFGLFMVFQFFVPHESSEWVYEYLLDWILIIGIFAVALGIWSLFHVSIARIRARKEGWQYSYVSIGGLFAMILFGFTARTGDSWGLYFFFAAALLLAIGAIMQTMLSGVSGKQRSISMAATAFFTVLAVAIAVLDDSWRFYFYTTEGQESFMFRHFFDHVMIPILSTMFALLAFFIASAAYRAFRARNLLATLLLISAMIVMLRFFPYFPFGLGVYAAKTSSWLMNVPNLAAQRAIVIGIGLGMVSTSIKVVLGIERGYMGKG
ncbi:MAG: hypothetical protein ACE5FH_10895 [Candidatus Zixiibacteriota bacterium]